MITGTNGSGKTSFLKLIGIIVYLAQIGSFVPAEKCIVSVFDRILTKFSKSETVVDNKSFFEMELSSLSTILENATNRSLVLIDEFGKGTHYLDGLSLFNGVWKSFFDKIQENQNSDKNSASP